MMLALCVLVFLGTVVAITAVVEAVGRRRGNRRQ